MKSIRPISLLVLFLLSVCLFAHHASASNIYKINRFNSNQTQDSSIITPLDSVKSISISPDTASIIVGATQQLTPNVLPISATNKDVLWKSSDLNIATVDRNGLVLGVSGGQVSITATTIDGNFSASSILTVVVPLSSIYFSPSTTNIAVGATYQLTPTYIPTNATNKLFTCVSENPSVAKVNTNGTVTGVSAGTTYITLISIDGGFKTTLKVNIIGTSVKLPNVISNNMVLQQDMQVPLWGWGPPNDSIRISGSWGQYVSVKVDSIGKWSSKIQTPKAVQGETQIKHTLFFSCKINTVSLTNILIGDVYLCSGQSNMQFPMTLNADANFYGVLDYQNEIALSNYPNIRINKPNENLQKTAYENNICAWNECNPSSIANFSAVAYYFARDLYLNRNINIPIGVIVPAVGASVCQAWTSREALVVDSVLKTTFLDSYDKSPTLSSKSPTVLFNGMISPLIPFGLKGFVWYQGESNVYLPYYSKLCSSMIKDWRLRWGQGDLPFLFVQLPANNYVTPSFRDEQTNLLTLHNTGMAISLDLADSDMSQVHPRNKRDIGKRLSLWAQSKIYGQNNVFTGPIYKSMKVEGNKIRIQFHTETIGSGLCSRNGLALDNFLIADSENYFVKANAEIDGSDVLVSAASISKPVNVAFAYTNTAMPNLINNDSLTACPFKTNTWNNAIKVLPFDTLSNGIITNINLRINSQISIYPTQANDLINISIANPIGFITIELFNIAGIKVYTSGWVDSGNDKRINLSDFPNGIYIVRIKGNGLNTSRKFLINK